MQRRNDSHSILLGYGLWLFGFLGAHRFYYGKPVSGTIWFFTFGLLGIGWLIDLLLIPSMEKEADSRYVAGKYNYDISWLLLTFLGVFGIHRFFIGKWVTGLVYLLTGGLLTIGLLYDFWTWNSQVSEQNMENRLPGSGGFAY